MSTPKKSTTALQGKVSEYPLIWKMIDGVWTATQNGEPIVGWAPQPGSQTAFLSCPVFEVLLCGNRGGGKSLSMLMDFGQHCGLGYGADWNGVIFRQSYPELSDMVKKTREWFKLIWPGQVDFNETMMRWRWKTGEELKFAHFRDESDYGSYHGKEFGFIGWEELTEYPTDKGYRLMMTCCRSARKGMPRKYRATTNPGGIGLNWVKRRFGLPVPPGSCLGRVIETPVTGDLIPDKRVAINCMFEENIVLKSSEPNYMSRVCEAASNPAQKAAWVTGDWNVTSGGMLDDLWVPQVHTVPDIFANQIPRSWKIIRGFDWGMSKPFSYGLWAESDGQSITIQGRLLGNVKGDAFRIFEWYGAQRDTDNVGLRLTAGEIAQGILEREEMWGVKGRVRGGSCDDACFEDYQPGQSVAGDMGKCGVRWTAAGKGPGSRIQGWHTLRKYLLGSMPKEKGPREQPGMFICNRCVDWIRLVPIIPRDKKNLDDVDTESEDHIADETRYYLRRKLQEGKTIKWH